MDVSGHQGNVDWSTLWNSGVRFAYVKATESTSYTNPYFAQQYNGSYNVGMIRGAYHFATPNTSSGAAQANYFVDHGGGWSRDGKTLPGALDMEYNPYGATCYGLSATGHGQLDQGLVRHLQGAYRTGRRHLHHHQLVEAVHRQLRAASAASTRCGSPRYGSSAGELPGGWGFHTIWQYTSTGPTVGDHNHFNGAMDRLQALANG